jgi:heme-binding NEAT domain protein
MKRVFEAKIRVEVHNDEAKSKRQMKFDVERLADHLGELVTIDMDDESIAYLNGSDLSDTVGSIEIDWSTLEEV